MILQAPAFIYPKEIWGLRPVGTFIGRDSSNADVLVPEYANYQVENASRRLRWFELKGEGSSITSPSPIDDVETHDWELDTNNFGPVRFDCSSYLGLRKPSAVSFIIAAQISAGVTGAGVNLKYDLCRVDSDMLIYPFSGIVRGLQDKECMGYTQRMIGGTAYAVMTFAVGTFAQLQIYRSGSTAGRGILNISLITERACRVYMESITELSGNPSFAFLSAGQTYAVQVKGPSGTDLAVSAGGINFNGGIQNFQLSVGRDAIGSPTVLYIRADFEVPYDI